MKKNKTLNESKDIQPHNDLGGSSTRLLGPDDRVMMTRLDTNKPWNVITNPRAGYFEKACSMVLNNKINRYVEYLNLGITRMVRFKDLEEYGIDPNDILLEHVLKKANFET